MSEEIKEILDRLDFNEWEVDLYKVPITWTELYDVRDYITNLQQKAEQQEKERDRLNNIMNRIDSFVDRTIEIIKQQPTGDDEWILERLNGIKYLIELKEQK